MVEAGRDRGPGSNAGLRSVSVIRHIVGLEPWAARINGMRVLAGCPRAYRRLACGAGVRETCHPTAGHSAGETDPVLAGI